MFIVLVFATIPHNLYLQEWLTVTLRLGRDTDYMKQKLLDAFKTAGNTSMNKTVLERLIQMEDTFQIDRHGTDPFGIASWLLYLAGLCSRCYEK